MCEIQIYRRFAYHKNVCIFSNTYELFHIDLFLSLVMICKAATAKKSVMKNISHFFKKKIISNGAIYYYFAWIIHIIIYLYFSTLAHLTPVLNCHPNNNNNIFTERIEMKTKKKFDGNQKISYITCHTYNTPDQIAL